MRDGRNFSAADEFFTARLFEQRAVDGVRDRAIGPGAQLSDAGQRDGRRERA